MTADNKVELAKKYTDKLITLVNSAARANENTQHVVYGSHLANSIPPSYAAYAFNELQNTLLHSSVIRACALFDKKSKDRVSLHTVIDAASDPKTLCRISETVHEYYLSQGEPRRLIPESDPEIQNLLQETWNANNKVRAEKEKKLVHDRVRVAAKIVNRAERLFIGEHLRPFRDNFIAHNLADESRPGMTISFILGMEKRAIQHAKCAVHLLHLAVNGTHFDWALTEKMHRRDASELWDNLHFKMPNESR